MIIGIPKEIKNNEFRVSATPSGVHAYVQKGHTVLVESGAGLVRQLPIRITSMRVRRSLQR
jgi:alanine dehydrogenase